MPVDVIARMWRMNMWFWELHRHMRQQEKVQQTKYSARDSMTRYHLAIVSPAWRRWWSAGSWLVSRPADTAVIWCHQIVRCRLYSGGSLNWFSGQRCHEISADCWVSSCYSSCRLWSAATKLHFKTLNLPHYAAKISCNAVFGAFWCVFLREKKSR